MGRMKRFFCNYCGQPLYFENTRCLSCGHLVGFVPERGEMMAFAPTGDGFWHLAGQTDGPRWRTCKNYAQEDVCNWMVPAESGDAYCLSCQLNEIIPDLTVPGNRFLWSKVEAAKRRLLFSLLHLKLPLVSKASDPVKGLSFRFLADRNDPFELNQSILTGHHQGIITINIAEADDAVREKQRLDLSEVYRSVLGHFRHEIGHYYWDRIFRDTGSFDAFRAVFGDERLNYSNALQRHYRDGAPRNWENGYITSYAAAHPWEDWAETWAHYLHINDTLQTAMAHGWLATTLIKSGELLDPYSWDFESIAATWINLRAILNELNRSMGLADPYPFVMSGPVIEKLTFIHDLLRERTWLSAGNPSSETE